jgi:3-oxoacyl-[acyl-carrier protein] reductase
MDLGLAGQTYVVTGGSRGLGFATAQALAADGARTLLVARGQEDLDRAVAELGEGHAGLSVDLTDMDAAETVAEQVGTTDGILINVGGPTPGTSLEMEDRDWQAAWDGVFMSSLRLVRAFAPRISEGGSALLVLSSTSKEPIRGLGASNALRPALGMIVKDVANTLGTRVRVNGILPGRIATDRLRALDPVGDTRDIPLARQGRPEEFGRAAAFLLSPAASYITGTLVAVDGGLLRSPW